MKAIFLLMDFFFTIFSLETKTADFTINLHNMLLDFAKFIACLTAQITLCYCMVTRYNIKKCIKNSFFLIFYLNVKLMLSFTEFKLSEMVQNARSEECCLKVYVTRIKKYLMYFK